MAVDFYVLTRLFVSKQCYQTLIVDFNYFDIPCLTLLASKLLGYSIIIITSLFMQTPQVVKILRSRSGDGVNIFSQTMLMMACTSSIAYGLAKDFPISTWGENITLAIQYLTICNLILIYDNRSQASVVFTCVYVAVVLILLSPFIPIYFLTILEMFGLPLATGSKILQIVTTYQRGNTGQLSTATFFFMNFRSFGRLFTSLAETGDLIKIITTASVSVLNVILVLQMFYYSVKSKVIKGKKKDVKQKQG